MDPQFISWRLTFISSLEAENRRSQHHQNTLLRLRAELLESTGNDDAWQARYYPAYFINQGRLDAVVLQTRAVGNRIAQYMQEHCEP